MTCDKCGKCEGIRYSYYRGRKVNETRTYLDTTRYKVTTAYNFDTFEKEMALCKNCIRKRYAATTGWLSLALLASFGLWFLAGRLALSDGDGSVTLYLLLKFISGGCILNFLTFLAIRLPDLFKKRLYGIYAQNMVRSRARHLPENRGYDTFVSPGEFMDLTVTSRFSGEGRHMGIWK